MDRTEEGVRIEKMGGSRWECGVWGSERDNMGGGKGGARGC